MSTHEDRTNLKTEEEIETAILAAEENLIFRGILAEIARVAQARLAYVQGLIAADDADNLQN